MIKIGKDNKKEVFKKVFSNLNKHVFASLMVLIDNSKIVYLNEVVTELKNLIDEENGVVTVEVLTISKLSELEKLSITSYFIKKLGKTVSFGNKPKDFKDCSSNISLLFVASLAVPILFMIIVIFPLSLS